MSTFPLPLDSYAAFEALFESSQPSGPASPPVPSPTKPFWSYPGLSQDWPTQGDDPDGFKATNPYAREGSEGALTQEADLVIVGSGITGVSIALELSRLVRGTSDQKMKVVILEARDFCSGATARNGGHLTASISHNYSSLAKMYDADEVKRCFALEKHTVSSLLSLIKQRGWAEYIDLIDGGHNVLMFSEQEYREALRDYHQAEKAGIISEGDIEWLSADETQREYGAHYPAWRSAGHNLWPLKLVTKLYELARDGDRPEVAINEINENIEQAAGWTSGVQQLLQRILPSSQPGTKPNGENATQDSMQTHPFELLLHTHTTVQAVLPNQPTSAFKWSIRTQRGTLSTNRVVYATNAYTSYLLPHLSGPGGIVPVRGQVVAIRADVGYKDEGWEGSGDQQGLTRSGWSGNEGFEYWFPRPHPKQIDKILIKNPKRPLVILGGARETLKDGGYGMYETDDSVLDPEASVGLRAFLGNVFPGKFPRAGEDAGINDRDPAYDGVEMEWSGIMGFTKSGDPFVGRVKDAAGEVVEDQYIAAGFTGHGMPRAYGCAEAVAGLIWSDISGTNWSPPRWLPRHYLTETF
ncbi:hypothetical protein M408DRAFT_326592 [Serendipita vermifera MAFF 305830]|uniref:FAD dependent oxidoreductase domain-containing protein n=1 Tax=Serendipita vermifera MAFF 305830 TaxID=933852 RepID=A0A0C2XVF9_SERVB|nr:hypothetical protein M408DRAFT_326592 [Serendipita vermifera MAFF 305830]